MQQTPPAGNTRSSIRRHFMVLMAAVFVALLLAVWYTEKLVRDTAVEARLQADTEEQVTARLAELKNRLQTTETAVYEYLLLFDPEQRRTIDKRLENATVALNVLNRFSTQSPYEGFVRDLEELKTRYQEMEAGVREAVTVASRAETRFPAMNILLDELYVSNASFSRAVESAIEEAREMHTMPRQREINELLWKIRYYWSQQISAFRIFVANRSGVFGTPDKSLGDNLANIKIYFEEIQRLLGELRKYDEEDLLGLQQSESLAEMELQRELYVRGFNRAAEIYLSDRWRADIPIVRERIQPAFLALHHHIGEIENSLAQRSESTMANTLGTTETLSRFIWLLTAFVSLLLYLAYLAFERIIRRPMLQVSRAMEAEATGQGSRPLPTQAYQTEETRNLITAFEHMRREVNSRQQRLESILDNAAEGIVVIDARGFIESANSAAQALFGFSEDEMKGRHIRRMVTKGSWKKFLSLYNHGRRGAAQHIEGIEDEFYGRRKNGEAFAMAVKVSQMEIEGRVLATALVSDVSERKAMVESLRRMAEHDALTGLYNRQYLLDELERVHASAQRSGRYHSALIYIDLDHFKYVNDTLGHLAGDKVLVEVTELLRDRLRKEDILARLGGDEFAILLYDISPTQLPQVADAYRRRLSGYVFRHDGEAVDVGCSIGAAMLEPDVASKEDLLARADLACHIAKHGGRNRIHVYTAHDSRNMDVMSADMGWARRIKSAIEEDRFILARQPIIELSSGRISRYELLLRMLDEEGDIIMPGGFLSSAERFSLSVDIDKWVIGAAMERVAQSLREGRRVSYAINLSADSIGSPEVMQLIKSRVRELRIPPEILVFEITETVAIRNLSSAADFITELRNLGCLAALDDFGSGYCSFAYLEDIPVDMIKIDGSFVRDLKDDDLHQTIVRAINDISHAMGKRTIAEFVEDQETMELLKQIGVDMAQGYAIGRPELLGRTDEERIDADRNPDNIVPFGKQRGSRAADD